MKLRFRSAERLSDAGFESGDWGGALTMAFAFVICAGLALFAVDAAAFRVLLGLPAVALLYALCVELSGIYSRGSRGHRSK